MRGTDNRPKYPIEFIVFVLYIVFTVLKALLE